MLTKSASWRAEGWWSKAATLICCASKGCMLAFTRCSRHPEMQQATLRQAHASTSSRFDKLTLRQAQRAYAGGIRGILSPVEGLPEDGASTTSRFDRLTLRQAQRAYAGGIRGILSLSKDCRRMALRQAHASTSSRFDRLSAPGMMIGINHVAPWRRFSQETHLIQKVWSDMSGGFRRENVAWTD